MPGIYGYIKQSPQETQIDNMSRSLNYQNNFIKDEIFCNDDIESGHMKQDKHIFYKDGIYISLEGEEYHFQNLSFEQLLYDLYTNKDLENSLNKLDGYFNAIIYDSNIIISDEYAGDVVFFEDWFSKLPLNERVSTNNLNFVYYKYIKSCNIEDDFFNINRCESYLYMSRVRRFTNMGIVNGLTNIDQRKPFFDNKLIEFIYSIPDDFRKDNKLYSAMLLKFFPKFFKDIPWQKTRKNLDGRESQYLNSTNPIRGYMNYAGAIREKSILVEIFKIIDFKNFTNIDAIETYLRPHLDSIQVNHIEKIFRFITTELYLRDVNAKAK
ncbi:MAG: hypothetical protein WCR78_13560 [Arcobacteraceae bacterium]